MSVELFYASGYTAPAYRKGAEAALAKATKWSPSSLDFQETAKRSGGGTGVANLDELLAQIGKKPAGSIDELDIIAHSNSTYFSLSGQVLISGPDLPNVNLSRAGLVDANTLKNKASTILAVRDRFATGGQIVLYSCHAGLDDSLLNALAVAFNVCVYGFSDEVSYFLEWKEPSGVVISRGKTYIDNGSVAAGLAHASDLARDDIHALTPGKKSSKTCPDYKTKTSSSTTSGVSGGGSQ